MQKPAGWSGGLILWVELPNHEVQIAREGGPEEIGKLQKARKRTEGVEAKGGSEENAKQTIRQNTPSFSAYFMHIGKHFLHLNSKQTFAKIKHYHNFSIKKKESFIIFLVCLCAYC